MIPEPDRSLVSRLNLNQLVGFVALANLGSFKAAAASSNISQSALSIQIRLLEESLGVALFHRTTRSVALTDDGRRLLPIARRALHEIGVIAAEFRDQTEMKRGTTSLAAIPTVDGCRIPTILRRMESLYPEVTVRFVVRESSGAAAEMVRRGEADFGIFNKATNLEDLTFTPIFRDTFFAIIPASERRFARRKQISLRDLSGLPLILQPPGTAIRTMLDTLAAAQGIELEVRRELLNAEVLVSLVREGLGTGVLPAGALEPLKLSGCQIIELPEISLRTIVLASSKRRSLSPAAVVLQLSLIHI